ncbi:HTH DNA-binding domain-containing protein [Rhizobium phage RHph_N3_2]|nr:HTH DNA-binding domain-containing protein [Rhizobium phage RHph_N3_2]
MTNNNADNFYIERAKWLDYVHARRDFTHAEFRVAYFIVSKINPTDDCMWYSVKRIAKETPASLATVEKTIAKLDACRLILIGKRKIGRQTLDTYAFRMPLDAEDQAFKAEKKKRKKTGGRKRRVSKSEIRRVSKNET